MQTKLLEVTRIGSTLAGVIDLPPHLRPEPGQFLPCQKVSDSPEILVTNLFRVIGKREKLTLGALPEGWSPGDHLMVLPPQGVGFQLPPIARRVGLLAFELSPERLLPLSHLALAQGAAVTLFYDVQPTDGFLDWVPSAVEVTPVSMLPENFAWLDYLAVDLNLGDLEALSALFEGSKPSFEGQVLLRTAMPCRGLGVCGVCAVNTTRGWRLACKDGPVFPLLEVLYVAQ
jgi:dihydroorotate dehydrogenase electron transfer subunit